MFSVCLQQQKVTVLKMVCLDNVIWLSLYESTHVVVSAWLRKFFEWFICFGKVDSNLFINFAMMFESGDAVYWLKKHSPLKNIVVSYSIYSF